MELVKELFVSGLVAVLLSFFVAKFVSIIVSANDSPSGVIDTAISSNTDETSPIDDPSSPYEVQPSEFTSQQEAIPTESATPESLLEENSPQKGEIEEDWEGIERSETDNLFIRAASAVESGKHDKSLDESLRTELHALKKVATEGPCRELPPMALKLTARANWSAWHKLGNMSPEEAMERYVSIVSQRVPDWVDEGSTVDTEGLTAADERLRL